MISKDSPVPLYYQVSNELENRIASGEYGLNEQLPSEAQLVEDFGVSTVTIRAAMRVLIEKNLLVRYRGKGTFVSEKKPVKTMWSVGSIDDLVSTGEKSRMFVKSRGWIKSDAWMADKLGVQEGTKIYNLRTIREADDEIFMVTEIFQMPEIGRVIAQADFDNPSMKNMLIISFVEKMCKISVCEIRQVMSVVMADKQIAEDLGTPEGRPLLLIERDYLTADGWLFQTGRTYYRALKHQYAINLKRAEHPTTNS